MIAVLTIAVILAAVAVATYLLLNYYPAFGASAAKDRGHRLHQSPQFSKGRFRNRLPTSMATTTREKLALLMSFLRGVPNSKPPQQIPVVPVVTEEIGRSAEDRVTWLGHSALLLELSGKVLLLDPMLGRAPSPFPMIGGKRYSSHPPVQLEALSRIDAVILSHDHYDHLDYGSIRKLKDKTERFIVPLGVGAHLVRWGVKPEKIEEHDWGDEFTWGGMKLACTPARHFSGRSLTDRNRTLWCSWVIDSGHSKVFFSGDSGYGPHFAEIGERYGPFDLTLLECGQYDPGWAAIHMMPEETVQAHLDVRGRLLVPIHWGAFTLALHAWNDPIQRAVQAAQARDVRLSTPRLGEPVRFHSTDYPVIEWW